MKREPLPPPSPVSTGDGAGSDGPVCNLHGGADKHVRNAARVRGPMQQTHNLKANPAATVTIEAIPGMPLLDSPLPLSAKRSGLAATRYIPALEKEAVWAGDRRIEVFVLTRN